jgi:hypothetical protein
MNDSKKSCDIAKPDKEINSARDATDSARDTEIM